jgi:hypothetical protein
MPSFFEMFQIIEGFKDWSQRYGVNTNPDPNAAAGQGVGQVRQDKSLTNRIGSNAVSSSRSPSTEVKYGDKGDTRYPITNLDAQLNANARKLNRGPADVGSFNVVKHLQQNNQWFAASVLQHLLGSPILNKGGEFNSQQLITALGMREDPMKIKQALQVIAQLPQGSPFTIKNRPGLRGTTQHVYVFKPQTISDPDEDQRVLGPRQINPARSGMGGVGSSRQDAPAPPAAKPIIDRTPPALQTLLKLHSQLDDAIKSGGGQNPRGLYMKMRDMLGDAKKEVDMAAERNPNDAQEWYHLLNELGKYLRSLPVNLGL